MLLNEIRKELKKNVDKEYRKNIKRFFKEDQEINCLGVRTAVVRKIAKKYYSEVKNKGKNEILKLCIELLETDYSEERGIAFNWIFRLKNEYVPSDFTLFQSWLKKHVHNWGACDSLCCGALGGFVYQFPEFIPKVKKWTSSNNRWFRRASAVVMITLLKDKKYLVDVFDIADNLLLDTDDMVQKGYGWMLKEASNSYPKEVFRYVMKHKSEMPRTALRYAIEKLSPDLRKKAMER